MNPLKKTICYITAAVAFGLGSGCKSNSISTTGGMVPYIAPQPVVEDKREYTLMPGAPVPLINKLYRRGPDGKLHGELHVNHAFGHTPVLLKTKEGHKAHQKKWEQGHYNQEEE